MRAFKSAASESNVVDEANCREREDKSWTRFDDVEEDDMETFSKGANATSKRSYSQTNPESQMIIIFREKGYAYQRQGRVSEPILFPRLLPSSG